MEAVLRVFKQIHGVSSDRKTTNQFEICSVRLLMASAQAIYLIGKQGSSIKSIQEESGAVINVLTGGLSLTSFLKFTSTSLQLQLMRFGDVLFIIWNN